MNAEETDVDRVREERDQWQRRCLEAERVADDLAAELAALRAEPRPAGPADAADDRGDGDGWGVFDQIPLNSRPTLAADGSDPGVLPVALGATSLVGVLAVLLTALNGRLLSVIGLFLVLVTVGLGVAAWRTRHHYGRRVDVGPDGVVVVRSGGAEHRVDLTDTATRVETTGRPGEPGWAVRFPRPRSGDVHVDASVVDPHWFDAALRRHRPDVDAVDPADPAGP